MIKTYHRLLFGAFVLMIALCAFNIKKSMITAYANDKIDLAQACGWYAISRCSKIEAEANEAEGIWGGGFVINTDDGDYPNFAGGYFCHVVGPKEYQAAQITASRMRQAGFRTAYAKNAC